VYMLQSRKKGWNFYLTEAKEKRVSHDLVRNEGTLNNKERRSGILFSSLVIIVKQRGAPSPAPPPPVSFRHPSSILLSLVISFADFSLSGGGGEFLDKQ